MADTNNNILREIWGKLCTITELLQNPTTTPSIDPEVVCLSNDGGTTVVTGWEVFDFRVSVLAGPGDTFKVEDFIVIIKPLFI